MSKKIKGIVLVGGPQKGTRFRPLSLDVPKPLFPVAGVPIIQHQIEALKKVEGLSEIILLGYFHSNEHLLRFIENAQKQFSVPIRYLQEYKPLGTGGGIYHFRDQILAGNPEAIIMIHSDVFCIPPLVDMLSKFRKYNSDGKEANLVLGTEIGPQYHSEHGNMVINIDTQEVMHYVEKPESYVSQIINGGVYILAPSIFPLIGETFMRNLQQEREQGSASAESIMLGRDIFTLIAGKGVLFVHLLKNEFWGSMKSAGTAIYANRQYLASYRTHHPDRLAHEGDGKPEIVGDVFIHPTAIVDKTAKIGPNVSIGSNCYIGPGARVLQSVILDGAELKEHSCVLNSIIGWRCQVGAWARIEGTPMEPNPNYPHALISNESLFHADGKLIPSITILGCNVIIQREVIIRNSIVLPHKELNSSYKNEIIL